MTRYLIDYSARCSMHTWYSKNEIRGLDESLAPGSVLGSYIHKPSIFDKQCEYCIDEGDDGCLVEKIVNGCIEVR